MRATIKSYLSVYLALAIGGCATTNPAFQEQARSVGEDGARQVDLQTPAIDDLYSQGKLSKAQHDSWYIFANLFGKQLAGLIQAPNDSQIKATAQNGVNLLLAQDRNIVILIQRGQISRDLYVDWFNFANPLYRQLSLLSRGPTQEPSRAVTFLLSWMEANRERNAAGGVYYPQTFVIKGTSVPVSAYPFRISPSTGATTFTDGQGHYYYPNGAGYRDQDGTNYLRNGRYFTPE